LCKKVVPFGCLDPFFNLNDIGLWDWEERGCVQVVVPIGYVHVRLGYPASYSLKHQSLVCFAGTAGDAYHSLLVVRSQGRLRVFEKLPVRQDVDISRDRGTLRIWTIAYLRSTGICVGDPFRLWTRSVTTKIRGRASGAYFLRQLEV
jgi:hypothetical protein